MIYPRFRAYSVEWSSQNTKMEHWQEVVLAVGRPEVLVVIRYSIGTF